MGGGNVGVELTSVTAEGISDGNPMHRAGGGGGGWGGGAGVAPGLRRKTPASWGEGGVCAVTLG